MNNYATYFTRDFGYPEEWFKSDLPHRNKKGLIQFITFRMADSLPQEVLKQIVIEIEHYGNDRRDIVKRKKYQYYLDKGLGSCALSNQEMTQKVMDALLYHDEEKYNLLAWSIMPNHVHVLIQCITDMARIVQSWKSYTGKWGLANNEILNLGLDKDAAAFWKSEYWDRFIRDEDHFNDTVRYILNNPVRAHLPEDHVAYLFTGVKQGLLSSG